MPVVIPEKLKIEFDYRKLDIQTKALSRVLSVFYDACTLKEFINVLVGKAQDIQHEAVEVEKARSLWYAEGVNLEALGRIVGKDRSLWRYSEDGFFHFDITGMGFDQLYFWCYNAPLSTYDTADDAQFKWQILLKIIKNHTLVTAIPEITALIRMSLDLDISFMKTGPMTVSIAGAHSLDKEIIQYLIEKLSDTRCDDVYLLPYPVTLSFDRFFFLPEYPFFFDREHPYEWDCAEWAVGISL